MARPEDPTARRRILEAAGCLFYQRGINAVGLSEIVAVAGTGKNVLYRHFPGKEELVLSYLQEFAERRDEAMSASVDKPSSSAALIALARHVAELVSGSDYRGCPMRNYLRETRDIDGPAGRFALAYVRRFRERVELLAVGLNVEDSEQVGQGIWLVLEGVYATTLYPDRLAVAAIGVQFVEALVAIPSHS